jgi:hypothetical protein
MEKGGVAQRTGESLRFDSHVQLSELIDLSQVVFTVLSSIQPKRYSLPSPLRQSVAAFYYQIHDDLRSRVASSSVLLPL